METAWDLMHKVRSGGWAYLHEYLLHSRMVVQLLIKYLVLGLIHKI